MSFDQEQGDADRLNDPAMIAELDGAGLLRAVAGSAAQARAGLAGLDRDALRSWGAGGPPRALCVLATSAAADVGALVAVVAAGSRHTPVMAVTNEVLPTWIGALDVVLLIDGSGYSRTLAAAADQAGRRGARLAAVSPPGGLLAGVVAQARGLLLEVPADLHPRASFWALAVPAAAVAETLGVAGNGPDAVPLEQDGNRAADRLTDWALMTRPDSDAFVNPAKSLALEWGAAVPVFIATSPLTEVAAVRASRLLAASGRVLSAVSTVIAAPYAVLGALDGPDSGRDIFADPIAEREAPPGLLVLLDPAADAPALATGRAIAEVARDRGLPVSVLEGAGGGALERLASLLGLLEPATVYRGLASGIDPTPVPAWADLAARLETTTAG